MGTILDFAGISTEQVKASAAVFAGHKDDDLVDAYSLQIEPGLLFTEDLPPLKEITGMILPWGNRAVDILLALLHWREEIGGRGDLRLWVVVQGDIASFQLIHRYDRSCRPEANPDESERDFLLGQFMPPRNSKGLVKTMVWQRLDPTTWALYKSGRDSHGTYNYLNLPGGYWAKLEFLEAL
jgi:hypothetical protein